LAAEIDKLPAEQVRRFVGWVQTEDAEPDAWRKIADGLRKRWSNETGAEAKHELGLALIDVLASHLGDDQTLAFLRLQFPTAPADCRDSYAARLFDHLRGQPWSAAFEEEAFTLLDKLSSAEEPEKRLFAAVGALHRLTDTMLEHRYTARMKTVAHPE